MEGWQGRQGSPEKPDSGGSLKEGHLSGCKERRTWPRSRKWWGKQELQELASGAVGCSVLLGSSGAQGGMCSWECQMREVGFCL